jgi:hypothetical protein
MLPSRRAVVVTALAGAAACASPAPEPARTPPSRQQPATPAPARPARPDEAISRAIAWMAGKEWRQFTITWAYGRVLESYRPWGDDETYQHGLATYQRQLARHQETRSHAAASPSAAPVPAKFRGGACGGPQKWQFLKLFDPSLRVASLPPYRTRFGVPDDEFWLLGALYYPQVPLDPRMKQHLFDPQLHRGYFLTHQFLGLHWLKHRAHPDPRVARLLPALARRMKDEIVVPGLQRSPAVDDLFIETVAFLIAAGFEELVPPEAEPLVRQAQLPDGSWRGNPHTTVYATHFLSSVETQQGRPNHEHADERQGEDQEARAARAGRHRRPVAGPGPGLVPPVS